MSSAHNRAESDCLASELAVSPCGYPGVVASLAHCRYSWRSRALSFGWGAISEPTDTPLVDQPTALIVDPGLCWALEAAT